MQYGFTSTAIPDQNADVNAEILTRPLFVPADPTWSWFAPRLHVGGMINTSGRTNYAYTGLTWTWENVLLDRVFAEFSFGAAFHDGYLRAMEGRAADGSTGGAVSYRPKGAAA